MGMGMGKGMGMGMGMGKGTGMGMHAMHIFKRQVPKADRSLKWCT